MPPITLTTDFGLKDWFVGCMKGVITDCSPGIPIIDLNHGIPPGDIKGASFSLWASADYFPAGSIHVVVVDPGVGGARQALAVRTDKFLFIGPDNGVLSFALKARTELEVRAIENKDLQLPQISNTFHGRDVFAPAAAKLAQGFPFDDVGPILSEPVELKWPIPIASPQEIQGEVLYIDHFGNAITNITGNSTRHSDWLFETVGNHFVKMRTTYTEASKDEILAIPGSTGFIEIACNCGNAATSLDLEVGSSVRLQRL
jgi:S-adenosylmethionine hydrolase